MPCLEFSDIVELNVPQVEALARVALENPDPNVGSACIAFSKQVRLVEGVVTTLYTMAAGLAKKAEGLEEALSIWQRMGSLCNLALETVKDLREQYPHCGTPELYDQLLDYKLACSDRVDHVVEELQCLTIPLPEDLFPALS